MAADYEPDVDEIAAALAPVADSLVVDGVAIGGSYGSTEEFVEDPIWGFPPAYFKQFASATPEPRAGYDPARDLPTYAEPLERDDRVVPAMLQRPRANHVVSRNGDSIVSGGSGGGNGGGEAKQAKSQSQSSVALAPDGPIEQRHLGRFIVYGLTRGEAEFYYSRRGEARDVLIQHVKLVTLEKRIPNPLERIDHLQWGKALPNFAVYGIGDEQGKTLRTFRGSARIALVTNAHNKDGARIRDRDRRESEDAA